MRLLLVLMLLGLDEAARHQRAGTSVHGAGSTPTRKNQNRKYTNAAARSKNTHSRNGGVPRQPRTVDHRRKLASSANLRAFSFKVKVVPARNEFGYGKKFLIDSAVASSSRFLRIISGVTFEFDQVSHGAGKSPLRTSCNIQ